MAASARQPSVASPGPFAEREAARELAAVLEALPLPALILNRDASALEANRGWTGLSGIPAASARGSGWLRAIEEPARSAVHSRLREAAADGASGSAVVRLTGAGRSQWSRWWWRPGRRGLMIACIAELDGAGPGAAGALDALSLVVHRMFGAGMELQSVAAQIGGPFADRLQSVVDPLDDLIRDARSAAFAAASDGCLDGV